MRDVYNEQWYLDVTAPGTALFMGDGMRFSHQLVDGRAVSPYGYAGIQGDPLEVRKALGMPLFIRYGVDRKAIGAIERPTRVIPLSKPWLEDWPVGGSATASACVTASSGLFKMAVK